MTQEFKGTKEILIDEGSIFKQETGRISARLTDTEGYPVATIHAPNFEVLKANALAFKHAPEMLELLELSHSLMEDASKHYKSKRLYSVIVRIEELITKVTTI